MSDHLTCRHPDRDNAKLMCGYPLPCPHHTVVISVAGQTVTIPFASDAMKSPMRERVGDIGRALAEPKANPLRDDEPKPRRKRR